MSLRRDYGKWVPPVDIPAAVWEPSLHLQILAVLNGFVVKPVYMLLSAYLLKKLWSVKVRQIRILWWGLAAFLAGETACAINYVLFRLKNVYWEMGHDLGMVVAFGLIVYAVMEYIDLEVLHVSDPGKPCALLRWCRDCPKKKTLEQCNLAFVYKLIVSFWLLLSVFPLSKPIIEYVRPSKIFGGIYWMNRFYTYQFFEKRIFPIFGVICLVITLVLLFYRSERAFRISRYFFAAGLAGVAFGLVRTVIFHANMDNFIMFDFWEEWTELATVVGITLVLWKFPRQLMGVENEQAAVSEKAAG